jgi:hypothetical protein
MYWDDFRDSGNVEGTPMNLESDGYSFTTGQTLTSLGCTDAEVSGYEITECFIIVEYTDNGTPTIEISADGGVNWETVTNFNIHTFTNTGDDLRIRYTSGSSGKIYNWAILYYPQAASLTETVSALTGKGIEISPTLPAWDSQWEGRVAYISGEQAYYVGLYDRWVRIVETPIMQNLISNSGLGVWSKSEDLFSITSNLCTNGSFDSDISDWTDTSTGTNSIAWTSNGGSGGTGGMELNKSDSGNNAAGSYDASLKKGRLYRVGFSGVSNSNPALPIQIYIGPGQLVLNTVSTGAQSVLCVPDNDGDLINIVYAATGTGTYVIDDVVVEEVGPGIEGEDNNSLSSWWKTTNSNIYREYVEDSEGPNSTYCVKFVGEGGGQSQVSYPEGYKQAGHKSWIDKLKGRTVAFGIWLKTDVADEVRASIVYQKDSDDTYVYANTDWHSGDDTWQWFEVTTTLPDTDIKQVYIMISNEDTATARFSCPMLIYGNYIGEGNYSSIQNDEIILDSGVSTVRSTYIGNYQLWSNTPMMGKNLQVDTNGKLPINVSGVKVYTAIKDSGANGYLSITGVSSLMNMYINSCRGLTANTWSYLVGDLPVEKDIIYYGVSASGVDTVEIASAKFPKVILK